MFDKSLIVMPEREFGTKAEVLHYLTHLENSRVSDPDGFEQDVLAREDTFVTYVGYDIGMPHARTGYVQEPFAIYARLKNKVHWGEDEGEDVQQVFLLGVPQSNSQDFAYANLHLQLLAALSRNLVHDEFREELNRANNADEIYDLLIKLKEELK